MIGNQQRLAHGELSNVFVCKLLENMGVEGSNYYIKMKETDRPSQEDLVNFEYVLVCRL
jgi:hypothetical protein